MSHACSGEESCELQVALPLRFHWHPYVEDLLEADKLAVVSQYAQECGFESVVTPAAMASENFLTHLAVAAKATQKIKVLIQCEASSVPKRDLRQRVSSTLELLAAQAAVYVLFDQDGKPFCKKDTNAEEEYYSSVSEFLRECRTLSSPRLEIFVEGVSAEAAELAIKFADCLWLKPKRAEQIYADALPVLHMGKEVGLRMALIADETAEKAHAAAANLFPGGRNEEISENGASLWSGAPSPQCPDGIALTGSFAEVAETLMRYKEKGISQFLFSAPQGEPVMTYFAADVLPIVRKLEADSNLATKVAG